MKSLSISNEQKARLVEMCCDLFGKDNVLEVTKASFVSNEKHCFISINGVSGRVEYHWFELCMNQLMVAIIHALYPMNKTGDRIREFIVDLTDNRIFSKEPTHPVDFLYEKFSLFNYLKSVNNEKTKEIPLHTI